MPESAGAVVRAAEDSDALDALVSDKPQAVTVRNYLNQGVFMFLVGAVFFVDAVSIVLG